MRLNALTWRVFPEGIDSPSGVREAMLPSPSVEGGWLINMLIIFGAMVLCCVGERKSIRGIDNGPASGLVT